MTFVILSVGLLWMALYAAHLRRLGRCHRERLRLERGLLESKYPLTDIQAHTPAAASCQSGDDSTPRPVGTFEPVQREVA